MVPTALIYLAWEVGARLESVTVGSDARSGLHGVSESNVLPHAGVGSAGRSREVGC